MTARTALIVWTGITAILIVLFGLVPLLNGGGY